MEGSEVTLTCTTTGNPTPTVAWQRNGGEVPSDSTPNLSSEGGEGAGSLVISPVRSEDGGVWVCVGTNIVGSNQQEITLTVLGESLINRGLPFYHMIHLSHLVPPTITSLPTTITVTEGTPHTITCTATGDPPPLISWSRGGVVISTQGTLSLGPSVARGDAGVYSCIASNTAGSDSREVTVDVQCEWPLNSCVSVCIDCTHVNGISSLRLYSSVLSPEVDKSTIQLASLLLVVGAVSLPLKCEYFL